MPVDSSDHKSTVGYLEGVSTVSLSTLPRSPSGPGDWCTLARLKTPFHTIRLSLICGLALVIELFVLRELPYSTSWIEAVTESEVASKPTPNFRIGSSVWLVDQYAKEPSLEPFREEFERTCSGKAGVEAGICAAAALAERSPLGNPRSEFVDASYDPVQVLADHLGGAPGHCTTRSALVAAELLAVGIPARVVQVVPAEGSGHNILGVWDAERGWMLIDPSVPGIVTLDGVSATTRQLLRSPASVGVFSSGTLIPAAETNAALRGAETALYPEPWLYMRVGPRAASWPFRGVFARIGRERILLGSAQKLLAGSIAVTGAALLVTAVISGRALMPGKS